MQPIQTFEPIHCGGVFCDAGYLSELDNGRVMASVERGAIQKITLRRGYVAGSPMLQLLLGLALTATAYWPLKSLVHWLRFGGDYYAPLALLVMPAAAGVWLIWTAFRRSLLLDVESTQGRRRLAFKWHVTSAEADAFAKLIEERYAVRIERDPTLKQ